METEAIDKLFLELSQVTRARTEIEETLKEALQEAQEAMVEISLKAHKTGYDWNADPENLTLVEGNAFKKINDALIRYRR